MKKDTASRSVRVVRATMLIVAAISLFFAQSLTWIRGTLFDKDMFSQTVTQTLLPMRVDRRLRRLSLMRR